MRTIASPAGDLTPPRPPTEVPAPQPVLRMTAEIEVAHLANPVVALQRLLGSEAGLYARVAGDDDVLTIEVALPDRSPATRRLAVAWVRWAIHCAGIRGELRDAPAEPTPTSTVTDLTSELEAMTAMLGGSESDES